MIGRNHYNAYMDIFWIIQYYKLDLIFKDFLKNSLSINEINFKLFIHVHVLEKIFKEES